MSEDGYSNHDKNRHTARLAVFVFLIKEGKTFLLRRANTGWADGMLTVPSGHIEKGETVLEAAVKEVKEEAGVVVDPKNLDFMHVHYVGDVYVNFYFKTTVWDGEPYLAEPELCSEVLWVPLDMIPEDTIFHLKHMLQNVSAGEYFSGVENDPNPS